MSKVAVFEWATTVLTDTLYETLPASERYIMLCELMEPYKIKVSLKNDRVHFEGPWKHILEAQETLIEFFSKESNKELLTANEAFDENILTIFPQDDCVVEVEVSNDNLTPPSKNFDLTSPEYSLMLSSSLLGEPSEIRPESALERRCRDGLPIRRKRVKTKDNRTLSSLLARKSMKNLQQKYKKHRVKFNEMYCEPVEQKNTKSLSPLSVVDSNDIYVDITLNSQLDDVSSLLESSGILLPLMNEAKIDDEASSFSVQSVGENLAADGDAEDARNESGWIDKCKSGEESGWIDKCKSGEERTRIKIAKDEVRFKTIAKKNYEEMTPDKYFCTKCSFKTKRSSHLEKHLAYHTADCKLYSCNKCSFIAIRPWILRRHKIDAHNKGVVSCNLCSYCTDQSQLLIKHKRRKHALAENGDTLPTKPEAPRIEMRCSEPNCEYRTVSSHLLRRHARRHEREKQLDRARELGGKDFKCTQCSYGTWSKARLERHASTVHLSARPHLCPVCGRAFKRADALTAHARAHNEPTQQFACPLCPRIHRHRDALKAHLGSVHCKSRTHLCATCGAAFKSSANHRKHVVSIHENPRAFPCPQCARKFNTKFTLARHLAKMHRVEKEAEAEAEAETAEETTAPVVAEPLTIQTSQPPVTLLPTNAIFIHDALPPLQDNRITAVHPENPSLALLSEADNSYCAVNSETATALLYLGSYTSY